MRGSSNAWDFVPDDPKLPRVLLIGDSVSRGYTQAVRRELAGKVNVDRAQSKCPHAHVILMAIFPRGKGASNPQRASIGEINRLIAPLAQKPRITFLDITAQWPAPDGSVSTELMPDSLHPNEKGYHVWAEALRPLLAKP